MDGPFFPLAVFATFVFATTYLIRYFEARRIRIQIASIYESKESGDLESALTHLRELKPPKLLGWSGFVNLTIETLVTLGRYREALQQPKADLSMTGNKPDYNPLLIEINLAEANYNLGQWDAAWERLRMLDDAAEIFPIARAGLFQQRAWIAVHQGRAQEAYELWKRIDLNGLPRAYHAEFHFTHVMILLALGDWWRREKRRRLLPVLRPVSPACATAYSFVRAWRQPRET